MVKSDLAKLKKLRYERYSLVLNEKEAIRRVKKNYKPRFYSLAEHLKLRQKTMKKLEKDVKRIDKQIARLEKGDKLTAKEVKRLKEDTFSIDISSTDIAQHHSKSKGDKLM